MSLPNYFEMMFSELSEIRAALTRMEAAKLDKNNVNTEEYLMVHKLAEMLGCTRTHIYTKVKNKIPHISRGSRIYFALSDVHAYMESRKVMPQQKRK